MSRRCVLLLSFLLSLNAQVISGQVFGSVRVVALDPQKLVLPGTTITIKAKTSAWSRMTTTSGRGEAVFVAVPVGQYIVTAHLQGFSDSQRELAVASNTVTVVQLQLVLAGIQQTVNVEGAVTTNSQSSTTETLTSQIDIARQPNADRTGSLAMITNNVPGTYVMHDHLHSRGGHGVTWEIDGVPVPNSNLASFGSQFDPRDVDALETLRGGMGADKGDRSYGVFNIVPRTGFEGKKFGDASVSYGSFRRTEGHVSVGDHSDNFAYYASGSGDRTDLGLERVDIPVLHDKAHDFSGLTSLIYNVSSTDQLRFVASGRHDRYQVPNILGQQLQGIDDTEIATDAFTNFTWAHASDSGALLTVSPYYHFNRGQYRGGLHDPLITTDDRASHYVGGYVGFSKTTGAHTFRVGTDSFAERDDTLFSLRSNEIGLTASQDEKLWANIFSVFSEDTYLINGWLTFNGGLRFEHFSSPVLAEHGVSPRIGTAVTVRHLGVVRASYSRYYQHPQTSTISGPILSFALQQGFNFLPVPGERDDGFEAGLGIPTHGWTLDCDGFYNKTRNAVDHIVLGNSSLLLPLTIKHGRVRAFESTLRSPMLFDRLQLHYAFSYQIAQGRGAITGGLTDFLPPANTYFYLDHDQRVTFNSGATLDLPWNVWVSATALYGSGFLRGDGPGHMPQHTTADIAIGKTFNEKLSLRLSAINIANALYLTGIDNSFAGTHYVNPREVSLQIGYKFHY